MKTRSASINSSLNAIDTENLCSSDEQTVSTTNEMQGQDPKEVATLNKLMEAAPKKELNTDDVVKSIRTGEESEQEVGKASGTIQLQFNRDFEEIENDLKEKFNSLDQHSGSSVSCDDGENDDNEKDAQNDEDFDKQGSVSNGLNSSITIIIETETENDDDDIGEMSFSKEKGSDYDMYNYILKHDRSKGSMQELNENEESVSNEIDSYSELEQSLVDEIETDSDAFVDKIVEACGAKDLKTDKCFQDLPQNLPRQVDSNLMYHNMNPCSGNEHANDVDDELETSRDTDSMNTNNPDVSCKEIEGILKLASVDTEKDLNNNKIETCPDSQYSDFSDIQDSIPQNVKNSYSVKSIPHDGLVTSETDSERVSPEVFHMTQFSPTEVYGKDHEIGYHGFNQWNSKYPTNGSQSNSTLNTPDPVIFEDCEVVGASWNPDSGVWPDMTENPVPAMNASNADQNSNLGEKQGMKRSYSEAMENMQRGLVNSCSQFSIPPASVFNNLINQGRPPDISTWTAVSSMGSRQGYSIDLVNKPTCKVPPYYQNQVQNPILNDNSVGRNPMAYNRSQTEMLDTASAINPFDDNYINNNVPQLGVNTQLQGHTPQFIPQQNVLWQSGTAVLGSQRFPCQYFYSQPRNLPHYFAPQNPPHVYRPSTAYCLDFASPVSIVQQPLTFISNPPYLNANITRPTPVLASQISQVNCHLLNPSSFGQYSFQPNPVRQCPERIANGVNGHLLNQAGIQPLLGNGAVDIGGQPRYPTNAYVTSSFRKHSPLYTATRLEQGPLMLATSMGQKCQGLNNGNLMTCSNTASSDLIGINKSVSKIAVASASSAYTAAFSVASHEHQLKMSFAGSEKLTKNNLLQIMNTMDTISRDSSAFSDTSTSTFSNQGTSSNERTVISQNETCDVSFEESDAATASVPCSEIDSEYGDVGDSIVTSDVNSNIISSSLSNTTDTNKDFVVSQKEILQEEIQSTSVKSSNASLSSHFIMQKKLFSEIYCKRGTFESQAVNSALDLTKKIQVSENSCSASVEGSLTSFQTIRPIGEPGLPMSSTLNNPSVPTLAYAGGVLVPYMNSIFAAMDNFKKRMETSNPLQQVSSMCAPVISQSQVQQVSMRHDTMSQSMPNTTDCLLSIAQALQNQSSSRPPSKPFVQSTPLINQSLLTNHSLGLQQGVTNPLLYRFNYGIPVVQTGPLFLNPISRPVQSLNQTKVVTETCSSLQCSSTNSVVLDENNNQGCPVDTSPINKTATFCEAGLTSSKTDSKLYPSKSVRKRRANVRCTAACCCDKDLTEMEQKMIKKLEQKESSKAKRLRPISKQAAVGSCTSSSYAQSGASALQPMIVGVCQNRTVPPKVFMEGKVPISSVHPRHHMSIKGPEVTRLRPITNNGITSYAPIPMVNQQKLSKKESFKARHFNFAKLVIGQYQYSSAGHWTNEKMARVKIMFRRRQLTYEFQLCGLEGDRRPMAEVIVPFHIIAGLWMFDKDMRVEVNQAPKMYVGTKGLTGSTHHAVYSRGSAVDLTHDQIASSPYHYIQFRAVCGNKIRSLLSEFDPVLGELFKRPYIEDSTKTLRPATRQLYNVLLDPSIRLHTDQNNNSAPTCDRVTSVEDPSQVIVNCSCTAGCSDSLCNCCISGVTCTEGICGCVGCCNPLNVLHQLGLPTAQARTDPCLMENIYQISRLDCYVKTRLTLECCGLGILLFNCIPGEFQCPNPTCRARYKYSWCSAQLCNEDVMPRNHCLKCARCTDYRNLHCQNCNVCYFAGLCKTFKCPMCHNKEGACSSPEPDESEMDSDSEA